MKNKISRDNPLHLEEQPHFLQIRYFGRSLILAKHTEHEQKMQEVLLSLWDSVDSAAVEDQWAIRLKCICFQLKAGA